MLRTVLFLASLAVAVAPFPPIPPFNCPALPKPAAATDARQLRPGNIKAVMTIGDSITAGFAMQGELPANFMEFRDQVYSIGGALNASSLFTYIRNKYNSAVQGGAQGQTLPMTKGAWLDAAVSGAKIQDWPGQMDFLVKQLKGPYKSSVDFDNDWKLLTIFMGANNLCGICRGPVNATVAQFEQQLRGLLTAVQQRIPRVFVNLIALFNISGVWDVAQTDLYCKTLWSIMKKECSCLQSGKREDRQAMDEGSVGINNVLFRVAAEYAAKGGPGFYTVVQPGLSGASIPVFGRSFLSNLDCFHPSLPANQAFAYQIWNNMMEPIAQKTRVPDPKNVKFKCPDANTFLQ